MLTGSRINVNDPGLITLVNKLQDVFTTVGVRSQKQKHKQPYPLPELPQANPPMRRCKTRSTCLKSPS
jgi:hypothetical protein